MKVNNLGNLDRRGFLKLAALSISNLAFYNGNGWGFSQPTLKSGPLGRVNVGKVELKARPDYDSLAVGILYEDVVVLWLKEVAGKNTYRTNQRWVETPDGYLWSPYLQPVRNLPNIPVSSLPDTSLGKGMWVEVSVPFVDMAIDGSVALSPGFISKMKQGLPIRLYYSQIVWVDQIRVDDVGQVYYRVVEPYGSYGDKLWGIAGAFRPITAEEMTPISPEVIEKRIQVDITHQTLSCYEGQSEVHFARISSGALYNSEGQKVDAWATPIGKSAIWRKLVSLHMSGGTTGGGWDLPGIGWTSLFAGSGVAIDSTFWHNNFGEPMSRGCVNAPPEDAKWIFRWTQPVVSIDPGDISVTWPGGTTVEVIES